MPQFMPQFEAYINAGQAGIWIEAPEITECHREIAKAVNQRPGRPDKEYNNIPEWKISAWDLARGDWETGKGKDDPLWPLSYKTDPQSERHLVLLHNYHRFLGQPKYVQTLANAIHEGKELGVHFIVLSPVRQIPVELERLFVVLEHPLPNFDQRKAIATEIVSASENPLPEDDFAAVYAASGLTAGECELAFAMSMAAKGTLHHEEIWQIKKQLLAKNGALHLYQGGSESFSTLGGLNGLKAFASKAAGSEKAKGIMLLGVPGTGKSAFCKALGNEVDLPTVILDVGACYGSLVGATEERIRSALRAVEAMAPCILMIDEIEKALAGLGSNGDSGTASRLFGTLLTWLEEHEGRIFVVATSNDISRLPPEFTRAERWDAVFFLDLPSREEKDAIWQIYQQYYHVGPPDRPAAIVNDLDWTGAEIRACCRLAALLEVGLIEAANYLIPVARSASEKIEALRDWASERAICATEGRIFIADRPRPNEVETRRKLKSRS